MPGANILGGILHWLIEAAPDYRLPYVSMHRLKDGAWSWDVYFGSDCDNAGTAATFREAMAAVSRTVEP